MAERDLAERLRGAVDRFFEFLPTLLGFLDILVIGYIVARLVAAALFLSPKTVEHHVGSIFRKRGFKSRSELAGAFARLPGPGTEAPT